MMDIYGIIFNMKNVSRYITLVFALTLFSCSSQDPVVLFGDLVSRSSPEQVIADLEQKKIPFEVVGGNLKMESERDVYRQIVINYYPPEFRGKIVITFFRLKLVGVIYFPENPNLLKAQYKVLNALKSGTSEKTTIGNTTEVFGKDGDGKVYLLRQDRTLEEESSDWSFNNS